MKTVNTLTLTALLASSGLAGAVDFVDYAQVVSSTPIYQQVNEPKRECWIETATPQAASSQPSGSPAGALIGGLAGGILGHQVGSGSGRALATAAGAITGAVVGDNLQNKPAAAAAPQAVERCRITENWVQRVTGYRVVWRYGGREFSSVLPADPGNTLRITVQVNPGN